MNSERVFETPSPNSLGSLKNVPQYDGITKFTFQTPSYTCKNLSET
jgi:hypothetical protein